MRYFPDSITIIFSSRFEAALKKPHKHHAPPKDVEFIQDLYLMRKTTKDIYENTQNRDVFLSLYQWEVLSILWHTIPCHVSHVSVLLGTHMWHMGPFLH